MFQVLTHESTGDSIRVTKVADGGKNTVLLVTGTIMSEDDSTFDIIDLKRLAGTPKSMRLDSLVFMVETGLRVLMKYRDEETVLPIEGRSKIDLDYIGGLLGHEIDMVFKGVGSFFIVLDISKIGV